MIKQTVYNIADTNIANLGSDLERDLKKASAQGEPAWEGAGSEVGLQIWRIEKFHVVAWPQEQYGNFFSGDSYICMNTWKEEGRDALKYDIHFWLGASTTQDEAGTAAYKTVELDTLLGDVPVQHREVEGYESPEFLELFESYGGLVTMDGGVDSGFNHVEPESYQARLLQCKGKFNKIKVSQVPLDISSLNSGDVFVLDLGTRLFQFNGATSGLFEKRKGGEVATRIREQRGGCDLWVVDESSPDNDDVEFWAVFGGQQEISAGDDKSDAEVVPGNKFFKLSDASGTMEFTAIGEGTLERNQLDSNDVFIIDAGHSIYVWIGSGASPDEKTMSMENAQRYIRENHAGLPLSITVYQERAVTSSQYAVLLGKE